MKGDNPRRVLIVDDHELIRQSVRNMVEAIGNTEVVGEATNGMMGVEQAVLMEPDLVIMDIHMPGEGQDGITATRMIKDQCPTIPIIILSAHANSEYVYEAVHAGAAGYLLKDATIDDLEETIRRTLEGEETMPPEEWRRLMWRLADDHAEARRNTPNAEVIPLRPKEELAQVMQLSNRETDVLSCVAKGWTNPEIAGHLYISLHTVKGHIEHILKKMGVSDRTQAAVRAVRLGMAWDGDPISA